MITRRGLLAGILAAGAAPVIMRSGILMPVRSIIVPRGLWISETNPNDWYAEFTRPEPPAYSTRAYREAWLRGEVGSYTEVRFIISAIK